MELTAFSCWWMISVFLLGYLVIIFEQQVHIHKTAISLLTAVLCWGIYFICSPVSYGDRLTHFGLQIAEISQIIFFLIGAMTLVELIDSHQGFRVITDRMHSQSKRTMLWVIAGVTFGLSAILDNLTTTIVILACMRKLVENRADRFVLGCVVVIAANAGGAWTPIGDVTTTMLWIHGQLSSVAVMKALLLPSLISVCVPVIYFSRLMQGTCPMIAQKQLRVKREPGAQLVLVLGLLGLVCVPFFKAVTGLPPFMGVMLALGVLWIVTDLMHCKYIERGHLRIPHVLTRVDTSGVLFFLGILLSVAALDSAGILRMAAEQLSLLVRSEVMIATLLGFLSAVIDNVPLVAATMGMYPLENIPMDSPFWHMVAYAAGTGGSMLVIGSAAGVAFMSLEKVSFVSYLRKASFPALLGYISGMCVYFVFNLL